MHEDRLLDPVITPSSLPAPAAVETITVTRVEYTCGAGTSDDIARRVVELHDAEGAFMRFDPCYPENSEIRRVPTATARHWRDE